MGVTDSDLRQAGQHAVDKDGYEGCNSSQSPLSFTWPSTRLKLVLAADM